MAKNPMTDILEAIAESADKDMKENSIVYRDLKASASDDLQTIFNIYDLAMGNVVNSMVAVAKERWHITKMSDELYRFLRDFPFRLHDLSREIEKTEWHICCVDKAWSRLLAKLPDLIIESGGTLPKREERV